MPVPRCWRYDRQSGARVPAYRSPRADPCWHDRCGVRELEAVGGALVSVGHKTPDLEVSRAAVVAEPKRDPVGHIEDAWDGSLAELRGQLVHLAAHAQRGDGLARIVADRSTEANRAPAALLVVDGVAPTPDLSQL